MAFLRLALLAQGTKSSRMAHRFLHAGVASSANECVFSGWKHILGDKRTRLGKKRQRDEMYIYANSRMCKNAKKCEKTFAAACDEYVESVMRVVMMSLSCPRTSRGDHEPPGHA